MGPYRIKLAALLDGLADAGGRGGLQIGGLALDSRRVRAGDGFVALAGARDHGLAHVADAAAAGAVVVLHDGTSRVPVDCPLPALAVPGLADALPRLAGRMWSEPVADLDLLAVTGTNGKTSVAWLVAQALDGAMIGTLGWGRPGVHRGGSMTTPDLLSTWRVLAELRDQGVKVVVLEASSHALDQGRLNGLSFSTTIFTTLGHDHLDYHASRTEYGRAKARLFTDFRHSRRLINLDDEFGAELAGRLGDDGRTVGLSVQRHPGAKVTGELTASTTAGLSATIRAGGKQFQVRSRLIGRINLWNLVIVAAELAARGETSECIAERIAALEPVPGRMQPVDGRGGRLAVIDYAHTPDALETALVSLREITEGTLWCVFGCGGDRDRGKRPRMGRIAESLADQVVLTDDNPRSENGTAIIRAIQTGMEHPQRSRVIRDRGQAIAHAVTASRPGDVVLVAGKGHETEQIVGSNRFYFDDARAAREALGAAA